MDRPKFEIVGNYYPAIANYSRLACAEFDSLEDASKFGKANLEEYVIYMHMKIEEKLK